jgi:hypothetical protein
MAWASGLPGWQATVGKRGRRRDDRGIDSLRSLLLAKQLHFLLPPPLFLSLSTLDDERIRFPVLNSN